MAKTKFVLLILGFGFVFFHRFFFVTYGSLDLFQNESGGQMAPHIMERLLEGRLDLDQDKVVEPFTRDGKFYSYFGIFPALFRGLISPFVSLEQPAARLTHLMAMLILIAIQVWTGMLLGLHKGSKRPWFILILLSLVFSGPAIAIMMPANVYHNAVLWGAIFGSAFNLLVLKFIFKPQSRNLMLVILIGVFAALPIHARASMVLGPSVVLGLFLGYFIVKKSIPKGTILAVVAFTLVISAQLFMNYVKWGNPFESNPARYHIKMVQSGDANEYEKAGSFAWDRIIPAIEYYFIPNVENFSRNWPHIFPSYKFDSKPFAKHYGYVELVSKYTLTLTAPILLLFSFLGLRKVWKLRQKTEANTYLFLLTIGGLIIIPVILSFSGLCYRYTGDWLPILGLLAMLFIFLKSEEDLVLNSIKRKVAFGLILTSILTSAIVSHICTAETNMLYFDKVSARDFKWLSNTFKLNLSKDTPLPPEYR